MTADPAELNVVRQQFARLASKCRPFAPLYRQITLAGLRRVLANPSATTTAFGSGVQYDDVRDAWRHYLQNDNKGRGVVLVGHSQGSFILMELIRQEIDGKPIQSRIVSAILMGTTMAVPQGKDVGGTFQQLPLCKSASQTGCVITFASFRSTVPPPANTLFGKVADANMAAACTNPASLGGGSGQLHAYLTRDGGTITSTTPPKPWVVPEKPIDTPWVSVPGLLTAECKTNENATYLEITVHGNPSDPRVDDITGDLGVGAQVLANWGLHLIDVNLAMGNLVDIVGQQAKAYTCKEQEKVRPSSGRHAGRPVDPAKRIPHQQRRHVAKRRLVHAMSDHRGAQARAGRSETVKRCPKARQRAPRDQQRRRRSEGLRRTTRLSQSGPRNLETRDRPSVDTAATPRHTKASNAKSK